MKSALLASVLMLQVIPAPPQGAVTGVIRDRDGVLPGATVTITRMGPETKTQVRTDAFGRFQVPLPEADYDLAVTLPGFQPAKSMVHVISGRTFTADINLRIATYKMELTIVPLASSASPEPVERPANPVTVSEILDAAKWQYESGRFDEAQILAARALELMRARQPAPASTRGGAVAVRVGGSFVEPRPVKNVTPIYPADALIARQNGVVVVDALIGTDGVVRNIRVVQGAPLLDAAVLSAVTRWQYTPAMLNGKPIEVPLNVSVTFLPQ